MKKGVKIFGVAINDYEGFMSIKGKPIKSYIVWRSMLQRCYSEKCQLKSPTYIGCTVCDEWKSFSNFKAWFDENYIEGFHLDKDILVEGNKLYSPDTCRFVPRYINSLLNDHSLRNGKYKIGANLHFRDNIFSSAISIFGKLIHLGNFNTEDEAHQVWRSAKIKYIKEAALSAFTEGNIKSDVYLALIRRKFIS